MKCTQCGGEILDGSKFCPSCGQRVVAEVSNTGPKGNEQSGSISPKATTKRKGIVIALCCALAVLVIGVGLFLAFLLPDMAINDFKQQVEARDYQDAQSTYEEFDAEDRTKANKWMREYISKVEEKYYAGKLDYATAFEIIVEMSQFDTAYNDAVKAAENVYLDNQSTIAFSKAKEFAEDEKWQEAYEALQSIHIKYRLYDEVTALRTECAANYRSKVVKQMAQYASNGEIDKLVSCRDAALTILPDDADIIKAAKQHLDTYVKDILAEASALAEKKDYAAAMELLQYAVSMYAHQDFWSALDGYGYDTAVAHCEALAAQNDLLGAVKYAKGLADADSKYSDLLKEYANPLVTNTLSTAKGYADNRQFQQAVDTINTVQAVYDCTELQDALSDYESFLPRSLSDCYVIEKNRIEVGTTKTDSFGTDHSSVIGLKGSTEGYVVFNLDGKFINLSGSFMHSDYKYSTTGSMTIYADGKLIYESQEIGKTTAPVSFDVDIIGVKQLRIEFDTSSWDPGAIFLMIEARVK